MYFDVRNQLVISASKYCVAANHTLLSKFDDDDDDDNDDDGKWFEPRSLSLLCGLTVRVRVVPRRTAVGDIDRRFDNLSGSHHQSHVNCVSSVYGICDDDDNSNLHAWINELNERGDHP